MATYRTLPQIKESNSDLKKLYEEAQKSIEFKNSGILHYYKLLIEVENLLDTNVDREIIRRVIENGKEKAILNSIIYNQNL